jgi:hypothetical protein
MFLWFQKTQGSLPTFPQATYSYTSFSKGSKTIPIQVVRKGHDRTKLASASFSVANDEKSGILPL